MKIFSVIINKHKKWYSNFLKMDENSNAVSLIAEGEVTNNKT